MTYMGGVGLAGRTGLNGRLSSFYNVPIVVGAQWRGCVVSWGLHVQCEAYME